MFRIILHILLFLFLTILTQVGGIVYLVSIFFIKRHQKRFHIKRMFLFLGLYATVSFLIVPQTAPLFGRIKIKNTNSLTYQTLFTIVCNRNYVSEELHEVLTTTALYLQKDRPETQLIYLDANFPFFDGFPLLPHLSHKDGKKIDLSFIYKNADGNPTNSKSSNSGYGVFENPKSNEIDQTKRCKDHGYWQYDYSKYLTFGSNEQLILDDVRTSQLVKILTQNSKVQKVFIEPHLKKRWQLTSDKIRFHGCKAVRHDDHIHLQV